MALRNLPSILVYHLDDFSQSTAFHGITILAANCLQDDSTVVRSHSRSFSSFFFTPIVIFSVQYCAVIAVFQF